MDEALAATLAPVDDLTVVSLRHRPDRPVGEAVQAATGWPWPEGRAPAALPGGWVLRLGPGHALALWRGPARRHPAAIEALAPGRHPDVMAVDVTEGLAVWELRGAGLGAVLARLMDAAPPAGDGERVDVVRLADLTVVVLRLAGPACWLLVERPLSEHLEARLRRAIDAPPP